MMRITDKYYVETDKYNWILKERHVVTKEEASKNEKLTVGEEIFREPTYHSTIAHTLEYLYERRQKDIATESKTIEEFITKANKMKKEFCGELKTIVKGCAELLKQAKSKENEEND